MALALVVLLGAVAPGGAQKQKKAPAPSALVAGTVFRDSGLSLTGAQVMLSLADETPKSHKLKKMEAITNSRGEFAFRVPPGPANYKLTVKAAGYRPQEKAVSIAGEESADVFILLEPASK